MMKIFFVAGYVQQLLLHDGMLPAEPLHSHQSYLVMASFVSVVGVDDAGGADFGVGGADGVDAVGVGGVVGFVGVGAAGSGIVAAEVGFGVDGGEADAAAAD